MRELAAAAPAAKQLRPRDACYVKGIFLHALPQAPPGRAPCLPAPSARISSRRARRARARRGVRQERAAAGPAGGPERRRGAGGVRGWRRRGPLRVLAAAARPPRLQLLLRRPEDGGAAGGGGRGARAADRRQPAGARQGQALPQLSLPGLQWKPRSGAEQRGRKRPIPVDACCHVWGWGVLAAEAAAAGWRRARPASVRTNDACQGPLRHPSLFFTTCGGRPGRSTATGAASFSWRSAHARVKRFPGRKRTPLPTGARPRGSRCARTSRPRSSAWRSRTWRSARAARPAGRPRRTRACATWSCPAAWPPTRPCARACRRAGGPMRPWACADSLTLP